MLEPACKNKDCDYHNIKVHSCTIIFHFRKYKKTPMFTEVDIKRIAFAAKLDSGAIVYTKLCEVCAKDKEIIKRTLGND